MTVAARLRMGCADAEHRNMSLRAHSASGDVDLGKLSRVAVEFAKRGVFTDDAVRANQVVLDVDPENVDALLRLLRCHVYRSEFLQAVDLVERLDVLALDESDRRYVDRFRAEAITKAAAERSSRERVAAARDERVELLASARTVPSAREAQILGAAYRGKDNELAIAFLERGLEIATAWEETLSVLAVLAPAYRDHGDLASAHAAYERAIEIEPDYQRNKVIYTSMTATLQEWAASTKRVATVRSCIGTSLTTPMSSTRWALSTSACRFATTTWTSRGRQRTASFALPRETRVRATTSDSCGRSSRTSTSSARCSKRRATRKAPTR
jgi:tetratricopeptide (TPR) repeat protein